jgi:hypothetical protein
MRYLSQNLSHWHMIQDKANITALQSPFPKNRIEFCPYSEKNHFDALIYPYRHFIGLLIRRLYPSAFPWSVTIMSSGMSHKFQCRLSTKIVRGGVTSTYYKAVSQSNKKKIKNWSGEWVGAGRERKALGWSRPIAANCVGQTSERTLLSWMARGCTGLCAATWRQK